MPDDYEIEESAPLDLARYVDIARRRYIQFLVPLLVVFCVVWGSSFLLKPRYKSTTEILVEQPSMPKNYVLPNVSEDMEAQLASISEQVMSRDRLTALIDNFHLFPSRGRGLATDQEVASLSKQIDVQVVHGDAAGDITTFSIGFTGASPQQAQEVTQELASTVIEQNLSTRQRESENTTKFLDQQLEAARQNLAEQEAKVKAYDSMHEGALPTQQQSNLQILNGLQGQLQSEQDALNNAISQRAYYQSLIEQYRAFRGPVKGADGTPLNVGNLDDTLEKERAQLADLRSRYTDNFPDVVALKAQIARTEKARAQALAAAASKPKDAVEVGADTGADTENSPLVQLQGQLKANQLDIANRQQAIDQLKARINDYQGRLGAEPGNEQELADLTRGYEQSQANYNDLLKKRDDSQMATSMEQMQQGERFAVLEPATLPWRPDFPNRLKFCALGIAAGLMLGLLSVAAFEYADDRMYSDKAIKAMLPVAVIAEIPEITTLGDDQAGRRKTMLRWAATAVVLVVILFGAAVSMVHP